MPPTSPSHFDFHSESPGDDAQHLSRLRETAMAANRVAALAWQAYEAALQAQLAKRGIVAVIRDDSDEEGL